MIQPLCSIIIPTYNHGKYIERSVKSALDQTYPNVEVIVVDDGSTDDTPQRLEQFESRILYHRRENGGLGAARNTGIELSGGEFLQFLDADDTIDATKIEKQIVILGSNKDVAVVYSDCTCTGPNGEAIGNSSYPLRDDEDALRVLLRRTLFSVHAALVRKSIVVAAGMFDTSRSAQEDWELWLRIALNGRKYKYISEDLAYYDQRGSEMTTNPELMYQRMSHMLRKYLNDPDFNRLDPVLINEFVAHQNFQIATRAYNNGWWKIARKHFLAAAMASPTYLNANSWMRIPSSIARQFIAAAKGHRTPEPVNDLDSK